jgi:hypothetical protein
MLANCVTVEKHRVDKKFWRGWAPAEYSNQTTSDLWTIDIGPSSYRTFGLSALWTIGPSDYGPFELSNLKTIGFSDYRTFGPKECNPLLYNKKRDLCYGFMVFNATFNNIPDIA